MAVSSLVGCFQKLSSRIRDYLDQVETFYRAPDGEVPARLDCCSKLVDGRDRFKAHHQCHHQHPGLDCRRPSYRCTHAHHNGHQVVSQHQPRPPAIQHNWHPGQNHKARHHHLCHSAAPSEQPQALVHDQSNNSSHQQQQQAKTNSLRPGFSKRKTAQGQVYFVDRQGRKHWYDPSVPRDLLEAPLNLDLLVGRLSSTWETRHTSSGKTYYVNHIKKTTQFTDPRLVAYREELLDHLKRLHLVSGAAQTTNHQHHHHSHNHQTGQGATAGHQDPDGPPSGTPPPPVNSTAGACASLGGTPVTGSSECRRARNAISLSPLEATNSLCRSKSRQNRTPERPLAACVELSSGELAPGPNSELVANQVDRLQIRQNCSGTLDNRSSAKHRTAQQRLHEASGSASLSRMRSSHQNLSSTMSTSGQQHQNSSNTLTKPGPTGWLKGAAGPVRSLQASAGKAQAPATPSNQPVARVAPLQAQSRCQQLGGSLLNVCASTTSNQASVILNSTSNTAAMADHGRAHRCKMAPPPPPPPPPPGAATGAGNVMHPAAGRGPATAAAGCKQELCDKISILRQELLKQQAIAHPCRIEISRKRIFEESFRVVSQMHARELKKRLLVKFKGEEGLDYGGVAREWFYLLSREFLNPIHGLFQYTSDDNYSLQINPDSGIVYREHLSYMNFCGRIMGMAVFHGHFIEAHLTLPFYKMLLGKPISLADIEHVDPDLYRSLCWLLENDISDIIDTTFSVQHSAFGELQEHELKPGGKALVVTEANKHEYVSLYVNYRCKRGIEDQFEALQRGLHELIPAGLLESFDERELELLVGGLAKIDVEDWRAHTKLKNCHQDSALVRWFWDIVRNYSEERRASLLQFVTGSPRVPIQGFKALQGVNSGPRLFTIHLIKSACSDNLPKSHTCFNRIDLPPYESYEKLRDKLTQAIEETMGFAMQ